MKKTVLVLLIMISTLPLFGESFFAFGGGYNQYHGFLMSDEHNIDTINILAGIHCTYFTAKRHLGFYISANFNYLTAVLEDVDDSGWDKFGIDYGLLQNLYADVTIGVGYNLVVNDKLSILAAIGAHSSTPYLPNHDFDPATRDKLLLGFNLGLGAKALVQIKWFYFGFDFYWDFLLWNNPLPDYQFQGICLSPSVGIIYRY